jgi:cytochrome P450
MSIQEEQLLVEPKQATCPFDHKAVSAQKTIREQELAGQNIAPVERDSTGVWHIRGFEEARTILRGSNTKQAGFRAELIGKLPSNLRPPILYQEGKLHNEQRKQTAKFFTPKAVNANYQTFMEKLADELMAELKTTKRLDLTKLSAKMAIEVTCAVIGLKYSICPGINKRINAFFEGAKFNEFKWQPDIIWQYLKNQKHLLFFFLWDVKPAIQAHKRQPQEDIISHLLSQKYKDSEILTEAITYGAAGMITTREFISIAAWHFLENPDLRELYRKSEKAERHQILEEILRVEPVVGNILRRTTAELTLQSQGKTVVIPEGDFVNIHVYGVNADETIVGEKPELVCPARPIKDEKVTSAVMGFGDGHHRCPGAFIAIQETDIFLQRLLALPGVRMEGKPGLRWNEVVTGYEMYNFIVAVD